MAGYNRKAAVIGAGVGGLATASRLAARGHEVSVFEKLSQCGGRANVIEDKGFKFDTGPSFVLMPDFFKEIFEDCGEDIKDHLDLKPLEVSYKIFFPDGDTFTVYRDSDRTKQDMERIESGSSAGFDSFIRYSGDIYKAVKPLLSECMTLKSLISLSKLALLPKIHPLSTFWKAASGFFKTDKLRYAFTFESMFMGVSPFETPAFYSVITYSDHVEKIAHPMGGMYQIPKALENVALKKGAKFNYNSEVKQIEEKNDAISLKVNGREEVFDLAVCNADLPYSKSELLGQELPKYRYSCSVFLMYMGLKKKLKGFEHHNLFFARDLEKNIEEIFKTNKVSKDPSFYLHVPTVTDPTLAPEGKEILYFLIPVPNLCVNEKGVDGREEELRDLVLKKMKEITGEDIEPLIETEHRFYPRDFTRRYNILNGATFGLSHNLTQSAFFRPPNYEPRVKNLYYVGASTQPGGGLPVVLAGSMAAVKLIEKGVNSSRGGNRP